MDVRALKNVDPTDAEGEPWPKKEKPGACMYSNALNAAVRNASMRRIWYVSRECFAVISPAVTTTARRTGSRSWMLTVK
jgi:hypothetical protein